MIDPGNVPSHLRISSENRSTKEYRSVFEGVSGEDLKLELIPIEEAEEDYETRKASIPAHMLGQSPKQYLKLPFVFIFEC